jgi:hypothetical protein
LPSETPAARTAQPVERPSDLTGDWLTGMLEAPVADSAVERIGTGQMSECIPGAPKLSVGYLQRKEGALTELQTVDSRETIANGLLVAATVIVHLGMSPSPTICMAVPRCGWWRPMAE